MGQKIKVAAEVAVFLKQNIAICYTSDNDKWLYIPFWFKCTDDPLVFERFSFEQLPEDLKKAIAEERNITP